MYSVKIFALPDWCVFKWNAETWKLFRTKKQHFLNEYNKR